MHQVLHLFLIVEVFSFNFYCTLICTSLDMLGLSLQQIRRILCPIPKFPWRLKATHETYSYKLVKEQECLVPPNHTYKTYLWIQKLGIGHITPFLTTPPKWDIVCKISLSMCSNNLPQGNVLHNLRSSTTLRKNGSTEGASTPVFLYPMIMPDVFKMQEALSSKPKHLCAISCKDHYMC